jgi:hypothetical protein
LEQAAEEDLEMRISRSSSLATLLIGSLAITPMAAFAKGKATRGDEGGEDATFSKTVSKTVGVPAAVSLELGVEGCSNHTGPYITISGGLSLGTIEAFLIFSNNRRGTHTHEEEAEVDVSIDFGSDPYRFNKQPPMDGAGGNPWIFVHLRDEDGNYIGDEVLVGRCVNKVQGDILQLFDAIGDANFTVSGSCDNSAADPSGPSQGNHIELSGDITLDGLVADVFFRNQNRPDPQHEHAAEDKVVSVVISPDEEIVFPKSPHFDGAGGNPYIFLSINDLFDSEDYFIARCNDLR